VADHEHGPERSRAEHYDEWARLVVDGEAPAGIEGAALEEWTAQRARALEEDAYSIHMHVWTQAEFLALILHCRERLDGAFDIEAAARQAIEFIVVLRKTGPPRARPGSAPIPGGRRRLARRIAAKARAVVSRGS
ncbi:MAG TPA: hypothetical protein VHR18_09445, partial [Solirubrobacterales bacterium]|nr:hypothetical protein [Solirubrobacterales bacterium]